LRAEVDAATFWRIFSAIDAACCHRLCFGVDSAEARFVANDDLARLWCPTCRRRDARASEIAELR